MFFSDAVFAIGMTLLVLDLELPELDPKMSAAEFQAVLADQAEPLAAFILSVILVGRLWMVSDGKSKAQGIRTDSPLTVHNQRKLESV